jgi:hypothetical protein
MRIAGMRKNKGAKPNKVRRPAKVWVWAPKGPIPKAAQDALRARLDAHVGRKWKGRCRGIIVRFRGAYAYVDAFAVNTWYMPGTTPEQKAQIDATPTHLCRLGYLSHPDLWEYAFYKYSDERYALSVVASGSFQATPEQAFDTSAGVHLEG